MNEQPLSPVDDEALSALLDGELDEQAAQALRARLRAEPALAARFTALERGNATVKQAYVRTTDEPLPRAVLDLLQDPPTQTAVPNVVSLPARGAVRDDEGSRMPWALAASIALAIGVMLGIGIGRFEGSEPNSLLAGTGAVAPGTALDDALQNAPSGARRNVAPNVEAALRLTFATATGDYCRQLELVGALGTTSAVACRRRAGWQMEVASFEASDPAAANAYRPAAAARPAVEAAIDALIDGEPLERAAEADLIARGWPARAR